MEPLPGLSAAPLPQDLASFLQQHPALQQSTNNRVKCSLTGHELPCRLADLQAYTKGKKYQRLMTKEPFNYSQFEPHIVPSTKNPQQLFCKLTIRHINKAPQHILRHVNGKRYQKALNKYQECVALGIPFVPACLSQKQKRNRESDGKPRYKSKSFWESDESGSESGGSVDSLSDLYPEQVLSRQEAPGEEAEMNELPNKHNDDEKMDVVTQVPRKRKHAKQNPFIKKKLKKQRTGKSNNGIKF